VVVNRGDVGQQRGWRIDYQIATPAIAASTSSRDLQKPALQRPRSLVVLN
jgi:exonuclease III